MANNPIHGAQYLINGFKIIFKPGLKRFVIVPFLLSIAIFIGLFLAANHFFDEFSTWLTPHLPTWLQWLNAILWLMFFLGFILILLYSFVTIANLFSAPFNSLLAEKVEFYLAGTIPAKQSTLALVKDIPRTIGRQLSILAYYLPRALLLLICFFIPIVQVFAAPIWFLFNAWFICMQFMDYPSDNHHVSLIVMRRFLKQHSWLAFGFGISVTLVMMIPIVNFFVMPAAIAGATELWLKEAKGL